ncbi:hypothetical protein TrST_g1248 [Triparma strigata]|uniref:Uncharacterized protein n=1 Tax=Triparma strigata TaxID=1606541 RepID=A0A9W7EZY9_9STRA|nr:hypothetical protein TrST_g1248 [Triparma strigata]
MVRRQSVLAEQLSGMKRAPPSYEVNDEPQVDKAKVANFRRLSTLYGSNVNTVAKTKNRKSKRMGSVPEHNNKKGGRVSPAFSMGSQGSMPSFEKARGRSQSQETVGGGRGRTQSQETMGTTTRTEYSGLAGTPGRTPDGRPMTADQTLHRLRSLRKNKKQNMEEPLVDRLSRPKSARVSKKFVRGPKQTKKFDVNELRESMGKEVHPDNEVGHPWYYGYNNSAKLPPSTPFAVASRFGYRGASALTKQCSERAAYIDIEHPKNIVIERDLVRADEWGPTLHNEAAKAYNNPNTPKQWPKAAEFPNGINMKEDTTTHWYNRETTLGQTQRRPVSALPERLTRTLQKEKAMLLQLKSTVELERKEIALARPKSAPAMRKTKSFLDGNSDEIKGLKQLIKNTNLNYWGEMSASIKRDLRPEYAKAVLSKHHKNQTVQSEMKWLLLREFYKTWRRHTNRGGPPHPGLQDLHEIASLFIVTSEENPLPSTISRDQFLNMLSKKVLNDSFDSRMAQKLYTCFDQKNTNRYPWVVIIASIRVLLLSYESTINKLIGIFDVFDQYARGKMTVKNCHIIFTLTAGSDEELHACKMHYNHSFRNYLRDVIVKQNAGTTLDMHADAVEFFKITREVFGDALRVCPKIVEIFEAQVDRCYEKSGVAKGMEAL